MSQSDKKSPNGVRKETPPALNFLLMGAGSIFTSMLIAGFLVGYMLDQIFETTPIMLMVCAVLGFIGGIQKVHKLTSKLDRVEQTERKDD
ncbi:MULTISPECIES: AtpZ/AtpI family protein [Thiomicrorhabdus]|uniref:AtpZ/AtpI family protein n=1 Tax=Thiomicrorhabdus heinhorstiae TaxID=2748010 RepID=A0ABS0BYC7_9GAMM|nr:MULTISPECIES: AtpZ/AtpI family protein [Thiomicrorhabdus]MBF6058795.1 AtpZ/AtpI family protein [Thiomicrorhabdus heinhorstiae]